MTLPSEPDYPIAALKTLLQERAGIDLSPIELAEVLWLALQTGEVAGDRQGSRQTPVPPARSDAPEPVPPPVEPAQPQENSATAAVVAEPPRPTGTDQQETDERKVGTALPVNIPEAVALRNRRQIARSLRPLKRKVPSKLRQVFDEEATVIASAEAQTWRPVEKPEPERWLELAIVIEVTNLLDVWQDTIAEFQHLLERHGSFRDVRTWQLKPTEHGGLQLFLQTAAGLKGNPRSPKELLDASGRRLILLVSDCTSRAWRSGKIPKLLELWSRENPITIVQLLPEHYWERSALKASYPVTLRSRLPGALSRDWLIEGLSPRQRRRLPGGLKLPVVTIQPESLTGWARAIAAICEQQTIGVLLDPRVFPADDSGSAVTHVAAESLTAKQLVQRFRKTASDSAQELADRMAVLPVNWSVIRLIQKNWVSQTTDPWRDTAALSLAEIFLSGLLRPVPTEPEQPGKGKIKQPYDFVEGVRDLLLGAIPISEAQAAGEEMAAAVFKQLPDEVQKKVAADIERRFGESLSYFEAFLIPDLPWGEEAATEIFQFARVTGQVLRRWGEQYAALAEELERIPPGPTPVTSPQLPSLQTFEFEVATIVFEAPSLESDLALNEIAIAWFTDHHLEVQTHSPSDSALAGAFDRVALDMGEHYEVLAPLLQEMKYAGSRRNRTFRYQMVDAAQTTISRCVGFGHNLLNENLLSRFDYDRATHTITGTLSNQPEVIPFFNGAWFERYVAQKILHLLQEQGLSYSYLFKPVVGRPGGDRLEPDLFFLVEGKPILIECQSDGEIDRAVNQILQYGEHLAIPPQQRVLIVLELTSAQVEHFAHLSSPVVAHRQNFLTSIQAVFGKPPRIDELEPFTFETATIKAADTSEWVITRQPRQAHQLIENLGNGITLEMVHIPAGSFVMGAPEDEEGSFDNERPQHSVTVPSFFMGRYPVTQAQWRAVAALPQVNRKLEPDPSHFKGDNRPVERVSWWEAVEFCQRLCQHTGRHYRLPGEAEWEYACRASPLQPGETPGSGEAGSAGTTTPFHFGETITPDLANYDGSYAYGRGPEGTYRQQTTEVGSFPANAFGLYDMHGNVWEWCQDHWHSNYNGAPTDGSAWLTRNENATRVIRGGSWFIDPWFCRSAYRYDLNPAYRYFSIGFRVCCSSPRTL